MSRWNQNENIAPSTFESINNRHNKFEEATFHFIRDLVSREKMNCPIRAMGCRYCKKYEFPLRFYTVAMTSNGSLSDRDNGAKHMEEIYLCMRKEGCCMAESEEESIKRI